jgi:hypothetical protein
MSGRNSVFANSSPQSSHVRYGATVDIDWAWLAADGARLRRRWGSRDRPRPRPHRSSRERRNARSSARRGRAARAGMRRRRPQRPRAPASHTGLAARRAAEAHSRGAAASMPGRHPLLADPQPRTATSPVDEGREPPRLAAAGQRPDRRQEGARRTTRGGPAGRGPQPGAGPGTGGVRGAAARAPGLRSA